MPDDVVFSPEQALALAEAACLGVGAGPRFARVLADATLSAELHGKTVVGFAHLPDYLEGLRAGRIDGNTEPTLRSPAPALIACDAGGGIAQVGFEAAFDDLRARARALGVALFTLSNAFTSGELGWYVRRLAESELIGLAASNGPALMKPQDADGPVYCTNPLAFAAPGPSGPAVIVDQSSGATTYVALRKAAEAGAPIPLDWAVDAEGRATTDAAKALGGALLTFGGSRGANIALMVEILAAGLSGANWSLDAPCFETGASSPGVGLTVVAIAPGLLASDFADRLSIQLERLRAKRVHIPGAAGRQRAGRMRGGGVKLPADLVALLRRYADPASRGDGPATTT